jgi:hypothetical protein
MQNIKCRTKARPLQLGFVSAFYHITSRSNLRDRIFFDDKDREKFLEILRRTKERGWEVERLRLSRLPNFSFS